MDPRRRASRRRPCPPLYSGRAGYKLETLMGEKTSWPLVVRLRYQPALTRNGYLSGIGTFPTDACPFAILSSPGLLCRSERSRATLPPFVCSFTWLARSGMRPARSRHAPGTRLDLPRRIRHKPPGTSCGALCPLAILCGNLCRYSLLGMSRGEPLLFPAQTHPPQHNLCRSGYAGSAVSVEHNLWP